MGPMLDARFAERYEEYLGWIQPHQVIQAASGRITSDNPRADFIGDPRAGLFYHPVVVDGVRHGDRIFNEETFGDKIGAGMVSINNSTSGAEAHLPFGGNGKSGNGSRQSGVWVLDQFTRWQAVNWDYSGRLQKAQMDVAELTPDTTFRS